jgi:hypothetical protein
VVERGVVKIPVGRPYGPDVAGERAAILLQAGAAALGMKIILIPEAVFLGRCNRIHRGCDVLNVVAVDGDQAARASWPQRRDDTRRASAPVVAGEHGAIDRKRIHQFLEVIAERGLLAGARRLRRQKPRRTESAQIRHDDAATSVGKRRHDFIIATRIVRPPVQQKDRNSIRLAALLICHIERRGADVFDRRRSQLR